jgi:hypothetical protein
MVSATSVSELAKVLGTARAPLLLDVRREPAFEAAEHLVAGAIRRSPERSNNGVTVYPGTVRWWPIACTGRR